MLLKPIRDGTRKALCACLCVHLPCIQPSHYFTNTYKGGKSSILILLKALCPLLHYKSSKCMCINDKKMPEHEVIEKYKVNLQNELLGNIYLKIN